MRPGILAVLVFLFCSVPVFARQPLPEDRGAGGLAQSLRRLQTTGRIAYVIAHPDDEDAGTITMLARGKGYQVTLLMLSRGGAAGDVLSSDFGEALGARRTLEMVNSSEYYLAGLRVGRFEDFAISKSVDRTLRHWNKDDALRDMVRFIRQARPHVLISRWQGTSRDRLGNHQVSAIVAREAFEAAGDARRFPEQIAEGLAAWQPLKLYIGNVEEKDDWTIRVDSAVYDPLLGETYAQIGWKGLGQQLSQANGASVLSPGTDSVAYYKLAASKVGLPAKEDDFFDRVDTSVRRYPELARRVATAAQAFDPQHLERVVSPLAIGLDAVRKLRVAGNKDIELEIKELQFQTALNQALGLEFEALVDPPKAHPVVAEHPFQTFALATPGQTFEVTTKSHATEGLAIKSVELLAPEGWKVASLAPNHFSVVVPRDAISTAAFWTPIAGEPGVYRIDRPELFGEPLTPSPLRGKLVYVVDGVQGSMTIGVETSSISSVGSQQTHPLAVGPPISIGFRSDWRILIKGLSDYSTFCLIHSNVDGPVQGTVHLNLPPGWTSEPASVKFALSKDQQETSAFFRLTASTTLFSEKDYPLKAVAIYEDRVYDTTFSPVTEPGLKTIYLAKAAIQRLRVVDVKVPKLRIGYVMGTGDEMPEGLQQLGLSVDPLDEHALCCGDLSAYNTIVLGIRAYLARKDLKTYNSRLLDYVGNGGVLVVQYNTEEFENNYAPYPYSITPARDVTEEDAPVEILDSNSTAFHYPNEITSRDFDGWVEKRGLRFMTSWDDAFRPMLSTHESGQPSQMGGLLVARYGRGLYIYTAYAFYRQLPFAIPGAVRLVTNLVSLGAVDAPWRSEPH